MRALPLLPKDSEQAEWIRNHSRELLEKALDTELSPQGTSSRWITKLGPLGPIAVLLAKSKALLLAVFKLKFLLTFFSFLAVDWACTVFVLGLGSHC